MYVEQRKRTDIKNDTFILLFKQIPVTSQMILSTYGTGNFFYKDVLFYSNLIHTVHSKKDPLMLFHYFITLSSGLLLN